jgi:hypothetical protein
MEIAGLCLPLKPQKEKVEVCINAYFILKLKIIAVAYQPRRNQKQGNHLSPIRHLCAQLLVN